MPRHDRAGLRARGIRQASASDPSNTPQHKPGPGLECGQGMDPAVGSIESSVVCARDTGIVVLPSGVPDPARLVPP